VLNEKNGSITIDELLKALKDEYDRTGEPWPATMEQQVRDIDKDNNGGIDFDEFCIAFREVCRH